MPTIDRPLHGDVLHFDFAEEEEAATDQETLDRNGRSSRTILKEGALRVTLIVLGPDGGIPEHKAQGPVTVQPLRGEVEVGVGGETYTVGSGELLTFGAGVAHTVRSVDGAAFLLTVAYTDND